MKRARRRSKAAKPVAPAPELPVEIIPPPAPAQSAILVEVTRVAPLKASLHVPDHVLISLLACVLLQNRVAYPGPFAALEAAAEMLRQAKARQ